MRLAAEWLDANEGEGNEAPDCKAVGCWLREQAEAKELRTFALENKVPTQRLKRMLENRRVTIQAII
jgi:hypothetical protein